MVQEQNLDLAIGEIDRDTAEIALNNDDWADSDEQRSDLVNGSVVNGVQGETLGDAAEAKNAKYDTLAELQYVDGNRLLNFIAGLLKGDSLRRREAQCKSS